MRSASGSAEPAGSGRASATTSTSAGDKDPHLQTGSYRRLGQSAGIGSAGELGLFDRRRDTAVFNESGGRIAQHAADSEYIHRVRFSIFAQVSLRATVRLKTGWPGAGIRIGAEVSDAFELITVERRDVCQRRFELAASQHFQRCRIQIANVARAFGLKQRFVEANLGVDRMRG